jgi:hypothetical protein
MSKEIAIESLSGADRSHVLCYFASMSMVDPLANAIRLFSDEGESMILETGQTIVLRLIMEYKTKDG